MARINKVKDLYYPTDEKGRGLGWTGSRDQAQYMAKNGYVSRVTNISELSLQEMWHDAVSTEEIPLEAEDGTQFLQIDQIFVIRARQKETGLDMKIMLESDLWDEYHSKEFPGVLLLKYAENPIKVR